MANFPRTARTRFSEMERKIAFIAAQGCHRSGKKFFKVRRKSDNFILSREIDIWKKENLSVLITEWKGRLENKARSRYYI